MVYKKYIKRNGKTFGPYYYESYREGNKVKTRFIRGPTKKDKLANNIKKVNKKIKPKKFLQAGAFIFLIIISIISFFYLSLYFNNLEITGLSISDSNKDISNLIQEKTRDFGLEVNNAEQDRQDKNKIKVISAEYLDKNRNFINNIYNEIKEIDGISATINNNEFVRIKFEKPLTNKNDITIYARSVDNKPVSVEVYSENSDELITKFSDINNENWYKVYLTSLSEPSDSFELKVLGSIEIDYIVDPAPNEIWNVTYDSGTTDTAYGIAVDNNNGVYVTGVSNDNYLTIKYNATNGTKIWNVSYDGGMGDTAYGIAVDNQDTVYVIGEMGKALDPDYFTIKYNATNGSQIWNVTYDSGLTDTAYGIAVDNKSGVYVTGNSNNNYYTIKYNATNGTHIWNATYESGASDTARGIAVDNQDGVYVTGVSNSNYYTIKYNATNNATIWNATYNGGGLDIAYGIAVSGGKAYVTGESNISGTKAYFTIVYNSSNGTYIQNFTFNTAGADTARGIAVDSLGNIYVTGDSRGNYTTVKYNSTGVYQWNKTDVTGTAYGIAVDSQNYIYVTGNSGNNYYTIKYNNVTAENTAPQITYVSTISATNPVEATNKSIVFYATGYDADGVADLNDNSFTATFNKSGETSRTGTCTLVADIDSTSANYSCTVNMWYWDGSGTWAVNVSGTDNQGVLATNTSTNFTYNQLKAIQINPNTIYWTNTIVNAVNQTADNATTINNTGNYNATGQIAVNAINLFSGTNFINVANFTVDIDSGESACDGIILQNATDKTITNSILEKGNLSIGSGTAQEIIYYCFMNVSNILSGVYDTSIGGSWTIKVL